MRTRTPKFRFQPLLAASLGGALLLSAGCNSRQAKASNDAKPASTAAARPAWNWEQYPLMPRMRLGTLPCQLQPKSSITVNSPLLGTLRVYVAAPQTNLPEDFLWAEFEPEIFAAEAKSLAEARRRIEDREKMQWEIEFPRKRLQMERQIEEAERQLSYLRLLSTNKELAELAFSFGPSGGTPLRPDSLDRSELEFDLLSQTMDLIQKTNLTALGFDLGAQRLEWERRSLEFKKRKDQSQLRMPFAGKLTLSIPITEGVTEYSVKSGEELGVIRDFSSIRVRVPIANASWSAIPGEKLSATVRMPSGEGLEATFGYQKIERNQNREESVYYFHFPPEKAALAARLIGTHVSCEIWVKLDQPVHVVPKLSLVLHSPEAFQNRSWATAVSSLFPGARLVAEGQTDVGIVLPKKPLTVSQVSR